MFGVAGIVLFVLSYFVWGRSSSSYSSSLASRGSFDIENAVSRVDNMIYVYKDVSLCSLTFPTWRKSLKRVPRTRCDSQFLINYIYTHMYYFPSCIVCWYSQEQKQSLRKRWRQLQDVLLTLQWATGYVADLSERLKKSVDTSSQPNTHHILSLSLFMQFLLLVSSILVLDGSCWSLCSSRSTLFYTPKIYCVALG